MKRVGAVAIILTLTLGCSYRILRRSTEGASTVSIVTLDNDSVEPGLELVVTRALRQEFLRRGAPRLIGDPDGADLLIRGRVLPLETRSYTFDTVSLAIEYTVEMTLDLDVERADGTVVWIDETALRESEFYLASADAEAARKNRDEALRRLADVLAVRIHDALDLQVRDLQVRDLQVRDLQRRDLPVLQEPAS